MEWTSPSSIWNESDENNTLPTSTLPAIYLEPVSWDWTIIIQLILAVVGVLGNSFVIHLYINSEVVKRGSNYKTYIAALALADLVTSICIIPYPALSRVPNNFAGHFYCKVVYTSSVMWISIVASVFTLTALTIDRYVAIAYPMKYKNIFTLKATKLTIILIWNVAIIFNTFQFFVTHLHQGKCVFDFGGMKLQALIGILTFLLEYLIPVIVMLVTNIRAITLLKKQAEAFSNEQKNLQGGPVMNLLHARQRVIKMVLVVIISFIICWSPDQFAFLAFNLGLVPFHFLGGHLYRAFVVLAFANSCLNPILYSVSNEHFRNAIRKRLLPTSIHSSENCGFFEGSLEVNSQLSTSTAKVKITHGFANIDSVKSYEHNGDGSYAENNI